MNSLRAQNIVTRWTDRPPSRQTAQAILALFLGLRVLTRTGPNKSAAAAIIAQVKAMLT